MRRWITSAAAVLLAGAVTAGTAGIGTGEAQALTASGCTAYTAVLAPGTWETSANADPYEPVGMLAPLGEGLKQRLGNGITVVYVPYAASAFDQGLSYGGSKATLVSAITSVLESACATTQFVLAGYSQGADGMGDVAADIGNGRGPVAAERVRGVGLLSDPRRDPHSEQQIGATQPGHGIAGVRAGGFGALTSRVRTVCGQGDMYCSVDDSASPFISAIGQALGGNSAASSPAGTLQSSLVSDWSGADPNVSSTMSTLDERAKALPSDPAASSPDADTGVAGVGAGASSLASTLKPLQDVVSWVKNNPAVADSLNHATAGSPQAAAAQVLNAASKVDLSGAITTATSLAGTAQQVLSSASSTMQAGTTAQAGTGSGARDALSPAADRLASQTSPLTGLNSSTLTTGLGVLRLLKPNTILGQITNVGAGIAQTAANIPAIVSQFAALPGKIATGDIQGAHQIADALNGLFSPLVKMAAGVDLGLVSQLITMAAPLDPSGITAIVGLVVGVLSHLDIVRIANDLGQAQQVLWAAVDKLTHGDLLGAGAQMTGLAPVGIDLAAAVAGMFTGEQKTDASQLGDPGTVGAQRVAFVDAVSRGDLAAMATALTQVSGPQGLTDIASTIGQGLQVANFYSSNAHTNYGPGVQELLTFLEGQISS